MTLHIYTDGSSLGNPGPTGSGMVVVYRDDVIDTASLHQKTISTNNVGELVGCILALKYVLNRVHQNDMHHVVIHMDSTYCRNGFTCWKDGWVAKDYHKVKNDKLWRMAHKLQDSIDLTDVIVEYEWVKAHDGQKYNEMADKLAKRAANRAKSELNL